MQWISVKEHLPEDGQLVIAKHVYVHPYVFVARFLYDYSALDGEYRDTFFVIAHPKTPKAWLFSEDYKKLHRVPKKKVDYWMPLPDHSSF